MQQILKPIEEPYSPAIAAVLNHYPKGKDGYLLQLFRVFGNSLRFVSGKGPINLLDKDSPLSLRQREIVILRVTANNNCEYEWGVHAATFAGAAKLSDEQIEASCSAADNDCWSSAERLLIHCVDQLHAHSIIEQDTYQQFQKHWSLEQQLEIFALCGNYHLISLLANTARLAPEPMARRFAQ